MGGRECRDGRQAGTHHRHGDGSVPGARGMSGARGLHVRRPVSEAPRSVARGGIRFGILDLLTQKSRHGYDIIRGMEEASGGLYSPSPGAVYPTLQALEDQGLVVSATEEGKKVYSVTEAGTAYLKENKDKADSHRERWQAKWGLDQEETSGETLSDIHQAFHKVKRAVRESAGDADKLKQINKLLSDAASKIEKVAER